MDVQEGRWDKEGTISTGDCTFFYGKGNENYQLGTRMFVHHRIVSAVNSKKSPYVIAFRVSDCKRCMIHVLAGGGVFMAHPQLCTKVNIGVISIM